MEYDTINDAQTIAGSGERTLLANRYRVVRQLGQGGMGSVWLVEDTQLDDKPFAVKMLPAILVANKRAYRQLKDEALVAMRLVHPNIVQIRAFEENDGNPFLVMDYVDGQTLDDYLAEKGKLSGDETIRLLRPIAAALDYAHGKGVVHRDVKPGNVMIAKDGTPCILDFGIAREIQETMTRVTGKLSSGTLLYMSPEQLNGEQPRPPQDVYSFAAMAYECLKGEPPFARGQIEHQILNNPPPPLTVDGQAGGTKLALSVMSGLVKRPEDRPLTCMAVLNGWFQRKDTGSQRTAGVRIQRVHSDKKIDVTSAVGESPPLHGGKWKTWAVMSVLGLIAVGGTWYSRQEQVREQTRIDAESAHQKAAAEEAKRKAEEAARQKAAEEEAKRDVDEMVRLAAERKEAAEIRIEAKVLQAKVTRLLDADGFKMRKETLEEMFTRAEALFDEKVMRWAEAAQGFSNYVMRAEDLVKLDDERQNASKSRTRAQEAFRSAEAAGAKTYAVTRWNAAVEIWKRAASEFGCMEFSAAGGTFASAAKQFETCIGEAKDEKERREAEARERAAKEARERERRSKWHKEGEEFTINDPYGLYMTMKWCPAGSFMMGSPTTDVGRLYFQPRGSESKQDMEVRHRVTLTKGFWMGETEVTQGQWKKLMNGETVVDLARKGLQDDTIFYLGGKRQTLREYWGLERYGDPTGRCGDLKDDVPVYNVTWNEANEFCRRLTQRERAKGRVPDGYEYRLPTEAEWEYACRAGTTTDLPNGCSISKLGEHNAPALDDIAWYGGNSSVGFNGRGLDTSNWTEKQYPGGRAFAREVKGKHPNAWGLYDMIGNVSEWCWDRAGGYQSVPDVDPTGAIQGTCRIYRGGSWRDVVNFCRPAFRGYEETDDRNYTLGFRIVLGPAVPQGATLQFFDAYTNKRYADAALLIDLIDHENANVQFCLGWMYENGLGVEKDEKEGVKLYRKAAEKGISIAQNNLGCMYVNGRGVDKDEAEAVKWFRKAAVKGNDSAKQNLKRMGMTW